MYDPILLWSYVGVRMTGSVTIRVSHDDFGEGPFRVRQNRYAVPESLRIACYPLPSFYVRVHLCLF